MTPRSIHFLNENSAADPMNEMNFHTVDESIYKTNSNFTANEMDRIIIAGKSIFITFRS